MLIKIDQLDLDKFRIVMETLTRIGVAKKAKRKLFQTAHIMNYRNQHFLTHYKILLNDISNQADENDFAKLNTVATLLQNWGMINISDTSLIDQYGTIPSIYVVPYKEKKSWELISYIEKEHYLNLVKNGEFIKNF